jgi:glycosyltransferase involved in cell wall biosynthesis
LLLEKRKDITFLAIGDHTDADASKQLIPETLSANFRLLGRRTHIESWVNMMDVCVLSTYTEGISNSILEYMAMEKPVVATDGGGTNELVEEGVNGFMVRTSDARQLAEKIGFLVDHPEVSREMGKKGRQKVIDVFSNEKMINAFISLYESVIRGDVPTIGARRV